MRLIASLTLITLATLGLGHVIPIPPKNPPLSYTELSTRRQPDGNTTIPVRLNDALFTFAPARDAAAAAEQQQRDMTSEHVAQPWQSNLCNTIPAAAFSQALATASERAPAADCRAMLPWLRANPGYFTAAGFAGQAYADLLVAGACAFGFYRTDGSDARFDLGNLDVIDLVSLAVDRYADADGSVGAAGQVACDAGSSISWSVYNAVWQEDGTMEPVPLEENI
ncbi:hypothetical protein F5X96DRAFT_688469 [Biscogniauxia mediterranea]|nr:hypothetical protein F5X96DRAFT_688469 [Biscogniauxia mediterranea]